MVNIGIIEIYCIENVVLLLYTGLYRQSTINFFFFPVRFVCFYRI